MMTLAAITDEFSTDLGVALPAIARAGITQLELRVVNDRNILKLTDGELRGRHGSDRGARDDG